MVPVRIMVTIIRAVIFFTFPDQTGGDLILISYASLFPPDFLADISNIMSEKPQMWESADQDFLSKQEVIHNI